MERIDEPVDALGIPTGRRTVRRLWVDLHDHLPRRYESVATSDLPGEPARVVATERFLDFKTGFRSDLRLERRGIARASSGREG